MVKSIKLMLILSGKLPVLLSNVRNSIQLFLWIQFKNTFKEQLWVPVFSTIYLLVILQEKVNYFFLPKILHYYCAHIAEWGMPSDNGKWKYFQNYKVLYQWELLLLSITNLIIIKICSFDSSRLGFFLTFILK